MTADLNQLKFDSRLFARLICREQAIDALEDSTLYILTDDNKEWNEAVQKVRESIQNCISGALWHLPYSIEALTDLSVLKSDESLWEYLENTEPSYNIIMPLYTPDRGYKCYFIGRIEELRHIEPAFAFLTIDAQKVYDECSFAAFAASIEAFPEEAKEIWMKLIDYNSRNLLPSSGQIAHRGKYKDTPVSEYTFLGKGFEKKIDFPRMSYADLLDSLNKFPDTIEAIIQNTDNTSPMSEYMEYMKICQTLSPTEKNELILELSKRIPDKRVLAEAIDAVMNKAKSSRLKIRLVKKVGEKKLDGRRMHGQWCTYLVDKDDESKKQWLDFEPVPHVVYIMNLIHRSKDQNKETASVLDISKHSKTFIAIFDAIYGGGGKEHYDRYFTNSIAKNAEKYDSKLLKQCYKIIKNCVNIQCSFFNESPAPYITDYDKPLTVDPVLIELSELDTNSVLQEASREFRSQK
jgi:hypothetical protein